MAQQTCYDDSERDANAWLRFFVISKFICFFTNNSNATQVKASWWSLQVNFAESLYLRLTKFWSVGVGNFWKRTDKQNSSGNELKCLLAVLSFAKCVFQFDFANWFPQIFRHAKTYSCYQEPVHARRRPAPTNRGLLICQSFLKSQNACLQNGERRTIARVC